MGLGRLLQVLYERTVDAARTLLEFLDLHGHCRLDALHVGFRRRLHLDRSDERSSVEETDDDVRSVFREKRRWIIDDAITHSRRQLKRVQRGSGGQLGDRGAGLVADKTQRLGVVVLGAEEFGAGVDRDFTAFGPGLTFDVGGDLEKIRVVLGSGDADLRGLERRARGDRRDQRREDERGGLAGDQGHTHPYRHSLHERNLIGAVCHGISFRDENCVDSMGVDYTTASMVSTTEVL